MTERAKRIIKARREKLRKLRLLGINPYPQTAVRKHNIQKARGRVGKKVFVAGRIRGIRSHGSIVFADLEDESGKIQLLFNKKELKENLAKAIELLDSGDFIEVCGKVFKTQAGEITVKASSFKLLAKSLYPLPSSWYGFKNVEERYRKRYLDFLMNPKSKELIRTRSKIVVEVRRILESKGFIEVETPTLQPIYGGANAKPFITYYNALKRNFYLKISDELYLKRLLIGGFEKVFEIDHDFRNEGIDATHNPEFTMMECYLAYADYNDMMKLTEEIYSKVAQKVLGTTKVEFSGHKINLKAPWRRMTLKEAIKRHLKVDVDSLTDEELVRELKKRKLEVGRRGGKYNRGLSIASLFKAVEKHLIQPVFITDFPKETTSLCKLHRKESGLIERFEPYIAGSEIGNAYTELNDPDLQRQFFEEEAKAKKEGDKETHPLDEDFLTAMEYGMPPTGGLGLGIDRMVMIMTAAKSIRDVIAFPTLRCHLSTKTYDHLKIEKKWQKFWREKKIYQPDLKKAKKPFYNLMMFPYPSASGLHVGNMYAFTGSDIYGRFKRMKGFDVFQPIGLDGFGIHSENYALKIGKHPVEVARQTEKNFYHQLQATGNSYSWDNKLETYDPGYYKWTQWIFIQMFKNNLAYRKKAPVNWCPSCKTVLSDEQVEGDLCERCKSKVEVRELEQWFFKITKYAKRLLEDLDWIDWTEKVKEMQKNWIGKSKGLQIKFKVQSSKFKVEEDLEVFTTRPDTIYGVTFIALSPHHRLVKLGNRQAGSGRLAGFEAVHPLTGEKLPLYVADYVLGEYGTAAVMGVPAYDERDLNFARENKIPIKNVLLEDAEKITKKLIGRGAAKRKTNYKLRDWCISRQRYWGPPIPLVNCPKCGWVPVAEDDLPVKLPFIKNWKPLGAGQSPLALVKGWSKTNCPKCGKEAMRETDVSDTFLDSAWYFFRYTAVDDKTHPWRRKIVKKWLPVDMYIGGAEHSVLHLMYSRFLTMVFHDLGFIDFEEPYKKFRAHGLLISKGAKMSKSRGNVVNPDFYIKKYGADTLRMYLMFLGPFRKGGDFQDKSVIGIRRFLERVWQLITQSRVRVV